VWLDLANRKEEMLGTREVTDQMAVCRFLVSLKDSELDKLWEVVYFRELLGGAIPLD
jgi:hypothetical protein